MHRCQMPINMFSSIEDEADQAQQELEWLLTLSLYPTPSQGEEGSNNLGILPLKSADLQHCYLL